MSTLYLKSLPNSTNIRFLPTSTKNLEIILDYTNWLWLLYHPKLSKSLSLIYKSTRRTGILL